MKKKSKYGLLIAIVAMFLLYVVLSWIIPNGTISSQTFSDGGKNPIGLFGMFYYQGITLGSFIQYGLVLLAIGALYGVIAKTGTYGNLIESVAAKFKSKEKRFLIVTIVVIGLLSSVIGLPYAIFIIIPFFIAVLTKLGYNKVTTLAATFGSMMIGEIGSTIGFGVSGISTAIFGFNISEWILFKLVLFVLVTFLFVVFVISNKEAVITVKKAKEEKKPAEKKTTKKTTKAATKKTEVKKVEVEEVKEEKKDILFLENEVKTKKSCVSLVVIFIVMMLLAFVSMYDLNTVFKISFFGDLYDQITSVKVVGDILGLTGAFGSWDVYELIALIVINTIIIGWVYSLSFDDFIDGAKAGAKRMLKPAFYIVLANAVFTMMLVNQSGTIVTYVTNSIASLSKELNVLGATASGLFASLFFNNYNYMINAVGSVYALYVGQDSFSILAFILQGVWGVMMLVLPTSLILVSGLTMMDVKITEWLKYIWKYVVQIFLIVVVLSVIILLLV